MPKNTPPADTPTGAADSAAPDTNTTVPPTPPPADGPPTNAPPQQPTTPPPASAPPAGNRFFSWLRSLGLTREPGWIGGVCAGIAARLGIDPLIVRGILVVIAVLGGPAVLLYAAAWLLLPDQHNKIQLEQLFRGKLESAMAGIGALLLLSMLPVTQGFWFAGAEYWGEPSWGASAGRALWTVIVLGVIVWFVVVLARRGIHSATPTPPTAYEAPAATSPFAAPASSTTTAFAADARADTTSAATAPTTPLAGTVPPPPPAAAEAAPTPPPAPAPGANPDEVAAWRERQTLWKQQHDAFRNQQTAAWQAANRAAQEKARAERAARYAIDREERARTRSHPLYTFIVIGLALVVGGLVSLAAGAELTQTTLVSGLSAAIAVLAVGIIINGIIGKRPGGASAMAIILLVPLLLIAVQPDTPHVRAFGDTTFTPENRVGTDDDVYAVGVGDSTVDLTDYYADSPATADTRWAEDNVALVTGVGDVTIILPANEYVAINADIGDGWIATTDAIGGDLTQQSDSFDVGYLPQGSDEWNGIRRYLDLTVQVGSGTITIIENTGGIQ